MPIKGLCADPMWLLQNELWEYMADPSYPYDPYDPYDPSDPPRQRDDGKL
jgi:hypothetical protein